MVLTGSTFDPAHAEHAGEGLLSHSSSLTTQRDNTRQIHRTHSWFVDEGSITHALSHRNPHLCIRHPAARGNVEGLVDHEGKVTAAVIGSAQK